MVCLPADSHASQHRITSLIETNTLPLNQAAIIPPASDLKSCLLMVRDLSRRSSVLDSPGLRVELSRRTFNFDGVSSSRSWQPTSLQTSTTVWSHNITSYLHPITVTACKIVSPQNFRKFPPEILFLFFRKFAEQFYRKLATTTNLPNNCAFAYNDTVQRLLQQWYLTCNNHFAFTFMGLKSFDFAFTFTCGMKRKLN